MKRTLWADRYRALLREARRIPDPASCDQALERFWAETLPRARGGVYGIEHLARRLWRWAAAAAVIFWVLAWAAARQGHEPEWIWGSPEAPTRFEVVVLSSEPLTVDAVGPFLLESTHLEEIAP
jgi:hypothetical protein|nr:MAG: hypothetical protein KatS3mg041_0529 [Bacteroidota bacterium]